MNKKMSKIVVRQAVKDDLHDIMIMIQELADFEKMSNGPTLTLNDLIRDGGFDSDTSLSPLYFCFVAEKHVQISSSFNSNDNNDLLLPGNKGQPLTQNEIIGFALCFYTYSTWEGKTLFMEDLYVKQLYRNSGVGKQLFNCVINYGKNMNCKRLDFHVLKWNPAIEFYRKMNAINLTETEEWQFYRLRLNL